MDFLTGVLKHYGIGLTGGIATGKSTVGRILMSMGHTVIDADQLARQATAPGTPGLERLVQIFGPQIVAISANGQKELNRKKLSSIVFASPDARKQLEAVTHPMIRKQLLQRLLDMGLDQHPRVFFYEASLLFETGTAKEFHSIWSTWCPPEVQIQRLMIRAGIDRDTAQRTVAAQMPSDLKASQADVVINTDCDPETLKQRVHAACAVIGPVT